MRFGINEIGALLQFNNKVKFSLTKEESPGRQQWSRPGRKGKWDEEEPGVLGKMERTVCMNVWTFVKKINKQLADPLEHLGKISDRHIERQANEK